MMIIRAALAAALALSVLAAPLAAQAQPATRVPRVGYLSTFSRSDPAIQRGLDVFRQELRELGYVEGQSIAIEYRWAEGKYERLPDLATELVRLKVDVIVASGGVPAIQAAKQATTAIPIIMTGPSDPVGLGLVGSLARPGGNITGLATMSPVEATNVTTRQETSMMYPCPICGKPREVLRTKKHKPYLICNDCGVQMFVRFPRGHPPVGSASDTAG